MEFEVTSDSGSNLNSVSPTVIKVVGCGGGGGNAVNCMVDNGISGIDFIAINTDLQVLRNSKANFKLQIGQKVSEGQGAGGNPEVGEAAAKEDEESIKNALQGADMVFVTAGMGGGTGTGSSPIVAHIAKELGALTVAVVTLPFAFEGKQRMEIALEGVKKLREEVDSLIVIPDQQVLKVCEKKLTVSQSFDFINDVLRQGVQGISEIITKVGLVNRDFHDVEAVMRGQGDAIFGIGIGQGENRASDAATSAINNKLLENTHIDGAKNLLINICAKEEVGMEEIEEIINTISASADKNVKVLWGLILDENMEDKISVTVIATGFNQESQAKEECTLEEEKVTSNPNVVDPSELEDLFNPGKSIPRKPENWGGEQAKDIDDTLNPSSHSLGKDISSRTSPKPGLDLNDFEQPASWRRSGKKRGISFRNN